MRNPNSVVHDPSEFLTPSGSRIHQIRELKFDGCHSDLVVTGEVDVQDRIEAFAPFCDLSYMLSHIAAGDTSVLNKGVPMYADLSGFPDNPVDAINLIRNAEDSFAELDVETKQKYNNDWKVWITQLLQQRSPDPAPDPSPDPDPAPDRELSDSSEK